MYLFEIFLIIVGILGVGYWFLAVFTSLGYGPKSFTLQKPLTFSDENFITAMEGASRTTFEYGGLPQILNNGNEFFPLLLKDISAAKHSIHICSFIFRPNDQIGQEVISALTRKAEEGVKVRLLIDAVGSRVLTKKIQHELEQVGLTIAIIRPFQFGMMTKYHLRNHCRAFVIDGNIGYTGGSAIGQEWIGSAQDTRHWRDMMFRVTGVQARAIQRIFSGLWTSTCGEVLAGDGIYPPIGQPLTESRFISFISSPILETSLLRNVYWLSCMAAQKGIYVQNSYFFPSRYVRNVLMKKAREGVEVILMFPNMNNDQKLVYYAGRFFYDQFLSAGVKIYEFQPTMMHIKTFLADDYWSILGSANMDIRSEELDEENVFCVLSKTFGLAIRQQFNTDLVQCKEITLIELRKRPLLERFLECICVLVGRQL